MKKIQIRIQRVIGQLEGIKKMMGDQKDCLQVLIQLKAAKSALSALSAEYLSESLCNCTNLKDPQKKRDFQKILKELTKV